MLAFDAATGRQHVLYSDGEDERLLLHQESVQWHELQPERRCYTVGLPEGASCLQGAAIPERHLLQGAALLVGTIACFPCTPLAPACTAQCSREAPVRQLCGQAPACSTQNRTMPACCRGDRALDA